MIENKGEPSLEKIDDYKGNESREKRRFIRLTIVFLIILSFILFFLREDNQSTEDRVLINPLEEIVDKQTSDN